jgi:hypothetical protein
MADGLHYVDTRTPHLASDQPAVTLTASLQPIVPVGSFPELGPNYFGWVGKAVRTRWYGRFTTGTTPGNILFQVLWGTGAAGNGIALGGVNAVGVANLTNNAFYLEYVVRCRAMGVSGALFPSGFLIMSGVGAFGCPFSTPIASTCDLTQDNVLSLQMSRSGSTTESFQVQDFAMEALN